MNLTDIASIILPVPPHAGVERGGFLYPVGLDNGIGSDKSIMQHRHLWRDFRWVPPKTLSLGWVRHKRNLILVVKGVSFHTLFAYR